MPRKKTATPNYRLSKYDWFFGSCPEEQLSHCFVYEYSREIESIRRAHAEAVRAQDRSQFDEHGNWPYPFVVAPRAKGEKIQMLVLDAPPGFPDKPYLSLKHRQSELGWHRPFTPRRPVIVATKQADGCFTNEDETEPLSVRVFEDGRARSFVGNWTPDELVHLYIDWNAAPARILAEMKIIIERLQKGGGKRNNQSVKKNAELKALGAVRLLKAHGSVAAAMAAAEKEFGGAGAVYSHEPEWSRAKGIVDRVIGQFNRHVRVEHEPMYFAPLYRPTVRI